MLSIKAKKPFEFLVTEKPLNFRILHQTLHDLGKRLCLLIGVTTEFHLSSNELPLMTPFSYVEPVSSL